MADIKTRDAVKGAVKTINKAAIASERMKSAYAKTKDKAEQSYYSDENSPTEYASDRVIHTAGRIKDEGVHQFNKQGQKGVQTTKENMVKAKDKLADFKQKRAVQSAEKGQTQTAAKLMGTHVRQATAQRSSVSMPQSTVSKMSHSTNRAEKTIKQSARSAGKTVRTTAKGTVKAAEKGIKTAQTTSKAAIKTTEASAKATQTAAKTTVKVAQRATQAAKVTAKATVTAVKATVKTTITTAKAIIAGTKALIAATVAGGWIAVVIILMVVLFGGALSLIGGGNSNAVTPVSAEVQAYTPVIQRYAAEHGISEYVELIKAVMMQESGGRGLDPMQASEGSFNTRYPNTPNGITDPEYSISCGVQELKDCLIKAKVENPVDMEHIKLALQGYNYGNGYISWAVAKDGGYTASNAIEFSDMMAEKMGWSNYGDKQYVSHVLRYYPFGRIPTGFGNDAIVQIALTQLGNVGGQPYWSWYGFEGRVEWCACFVSWCAEQCGYLESGAIPKFAGCVQGSQWFKDRGQWQDGSFTPSAGHIIFFDWEGDGETDHVGIVERVENGTVYTVEGNSGDACRQRSYPIGSSVIYGYGLPAY